MIFTRGLVDKIIYLYPLVETGDARAGRIGKENIEPLLVRKSALLCV